MEEGERRCNGAEGRRDVVRSLEGESWPSVPRSRCITGHR